jgi:hypothetical protein
MEKRNKGKKINILNFASWNVQGISYKEDQLDYILAKKSIKFRIYGLCLLAYTNYSDFITKWNEVQHKKVSKIFFWISNLTETALNVLFLPWFARVRQATLLWFEINCAIKKSLSFGGLLGRRISLSHYFYWHKVKLSRKAYFLEWMTFQKLSSCNIIEVIVALVIRGYCCTYVILKLLSKAIVAQVSSDNYFQSFLHLRYPRFHCCKKKKTRWADRHGRAPDLFFAHSRTGVLNLVLASTTVLFWHGIVFF